MLPVKEQLKTLIELQELDLKLRDLNQSQFKLQASLQARQESLNLVGERLNQKNKELLELQKNLDQAQAAIQVNQERISRLQERIPSIDKMQEFHLATKEVEQLKALENSLVERRKNCEQLLSSAQAEQQVLQKDHEDLQNALKVDQAQWSKEESEIEVQKAPLEEKKAHSEALLPKSVLIHYRRVSQFRKGIALSLAIEGKCQECNMMLTPQIYLELKSDKGLLNCSHCHRILYAALEEESSLNRVEVQGG